MNHPAQISPAVDASGRSDSPAWIYGSYGRRGILRSLVRSTQPGDADVAGIVFSSPAQSTPGAPLSVGLSIILVSAFP
jgi:hypothetical protein